MSSVTKAILLLAVSVGIIAGAPFVGASLEGPSGDFILWQLRVPRVLAASAVGASLAGTGAAFQLLFANPLATPSTIGTTAGASLGVLAVLVLGVSADVGLAAAAFLNRTIWGRYLLALGRNEEAARYSGVPIERMKILAYIICSGTAGLGGILFALDVNSVQPAGQGNFYELYAIAAAVLGGCSLRGGEGSILGVIIGAAVMRVLYNAINVLGIPTQLEFAIIGIVILTGVIADELIRRVAARRST